MVASARNVSTAVVRSSRGISTQRIAYSITKTATVSGGVESHTKCVQVLNGSPRYTTTEAMATAANMLAQVAVTWRV